jgi:uncharacterized protein (TIGR02246 family)
MKRVSVLLIALTLLALPAVAQTKGSAKDREAIRSIALKWQDTWNRHDMKALAALVAEDADLVTVGGTWLRSRKEFEQDHAKSHETVLRDSVLKVKIPEIKFIRPDVAVAHVEWGIEGIKDAEGKLRQPQQGIFTWVLEKRKGAWLIIAAQNTIVREQTPRR